MANSLNILSDMLKICESFVRNGFELAKDSQAVLVFDEQLWQKVSRDTGFCVEAIRHVHHSFYWELVSKDTKDEEMPFEYNQSKHSGGKSSITLSIPCSEINIQKFSEKLYTNHWQYMGNRLNKFLQQAS